MKILIIIFLITILQTSYAVINNNILYVDTNTLNILDS